MNRTSLLLASAVAVAAVAAFYLIAIRPAGQLPAEQAPTAALVTRPASVPAPAPSTPAPPARVEMPPGVAPLGAQDVPAALADLIGRKAVATFLSASDFPRRFVATVDNLGRSHAPALVWPVNTTPGRFTVQEEGSTVIAADNSARYTPFVLLVETIDISRAADLYVRLYPLLQREYEQLGYPNQYFNDRLVAVIGQLLATPKIPYPVKLHLTEVKGPIASLRPWVRYEFADPSLESLSAGQKILLRVGEVNGHRLKAKLAEFRQELAKRTTPR